jgi:transposase
MAMGKRRAKPQALWVSRDEIPKAASHPFYSKVNEVLAEHRIDQRLEHLCRRYYKGPYGRPSIAPGVYFRMLLIGFFEGIDSERGIAWRVADSLSLREFVGASLTEPTPDHSTVSRTRRLFSVETHKAVFRWFVRILSTEGLLQGQTIAIDATTLEANAAMRSIRRRDDGRCYEAYLRELAQAEGIEKPTRQQLARLDRKRKKKGSNQEWMSPADPDARITKMKDGRTHLAHKAEHAVDLSSGAVLAVTLQAADAGDTATIQQTLAEAQAQAEMINQRGVEEVVADKGYHSDQVLGDLHAAGTRSYIPEPERGRRKWQGRKSAQQRVYANRRRMEGPRGKPLQNLRSELTERSFAHMYETGGMRRTHLRHHTNIVKRLLLHAVAFNLALMIRQKYGMGKPRSLRRASDWSLLLRIAVITVCAAFGKYQNWTAYRNHNVRSNASPSTPWCHRATCRASSNHLLPRAAGAKRDPLVPVVVWIAILEALVYKNRHDGEPVVRLKENLLCD